jgi:HD-GYP domain-containing protein (c-di-GMP phosphodiesterase class II)
MELALPETPRHLRWMIARRMASAALVMGVGAGYAAYAYESHRAEQLSLAHALDGAKHFETTAMELSLDGRSSESHAALRELLDPKEFIGIRVFSPDKAVISESWAAVPDAVVSAINTSAHNWPEAKKSHSKWLEVAGVRYIQTLLSLQTPDGKQAGFLESISRLDEQVIKAQQDQIRTTVAVAVFAVLGTALFLYPLLLAMMQRSVKLAGDLVASNLSLLKSLGNAIAKRDSDTDAHNYRVTIYAVSLAEALNLPHEEISSLVAGAFLHDVGKIGIPDSILLKPGKLTDEEFEVMKTHVHLGVDIVTDNTWLKDASLTIRHHHERFDGSGYPDRLQGNSIPRVARIFAVVDVFDALTSARPYKNPWSIDEALAHIEQQVDCHFDGQIVMTFKTIVSRLYSTTRQASEAELHTQLQQILQKYFKVA